jgi:hypothetical protein
VWRWSRPMAGVRGSEDLRAGSRDEPAATRVQAVRRSYQMMKATDLRDRHDAPCPGGVTARGIGVSLSSDKCVRDRS